MRKITHTYRYNPSKIVPSKVGNLVLDNLVTIPLDSNEVISFSVGVLHVDQRTNHGKSGGSSSLITNDDEVIAVETYRLAS